MWYVYLLSNGTRTYIGSTTDIIRRLRQHNGEIRGGARSTRGKGPWKIVCYISGFENRSSACRWERILKCRARGLDRRHAYMKRVGLYKRCPIRKSTDRWYDVPDGLRFHYDCT